MNEAVYTPRPPGSLGISAGFSGWHPMGNVHAIINGIPHTGANSTTLSRAASNRLRQRLSRASGVTIAANTPLLYRLIRHNPTAARKYRTLYIGSSKDGNVARRLVTHVYGLPAGSTALYRWLNQRLPSRSDPDWQRRMGQKLQRIYLHLGFATDQPRARTDYQRDLNYNELFLIEKMLQRRYRPLVWDPNDRAFDEALFDDGFF